MIKLKGGTLYAKHPAAHVPAFLYTRVSPASLRIIAVHSSGLRGGGRAIEWDLLQWIFQPGGVLWSNGLLSKFSALSSIVPPLHLQKWFFFTFACSYHWKNRPCPTRATTRLSGDVHKTVEVWFYETLKPSWGLMGYLSFAKCKDV